MKNDEFPPQGNIQLDLEFLVANIHEPQSKLYLRTPTIDALQRIGYDPMEATQVVNAYFRVTLQ